jgi:hypothetical protein
VSLILDQISISAKTTKEPFIQILILAAEMRDPGLSFFEACFVERDELPVPGHGLVIEPAQGPFEERVPDAGTFVELTSVLVFTPQPAQRRGKFWDIDHPWSLTRVGVLGRVHDCLISSERLHERISS